MSESDSDDSFDKEAERERLREKYERDDADSEATERMSQLLLQGATMTNRHCDECGSPVFRHEGRAFCPNCQVEYATQQAAEGDGDGEEAAQQKSQAAGQQGGQANRQQTGGQQGGQANRQQTGGHRGSHSQQQPTGQQPQARRQQADEQPARQPGATGQRADAAGPSPAADAAPRDALAQTVTVLARRAAQTEDAGRAREWLSAAREAAEALAALDGHN
ncbi:MAG: Sjogren's syndrome/scleroderma autoantigen 1 family protein [Halobacteriaceae archaeon]